MKLAILRNSDVMEENGFRIRTQRPKIIQKQVVLFQDKKVNFVDLCNQGCIYKLLGNNKKILPNSTEPEKLTPNLPRSHVLCQPTYNYIKVILFMSEKTCGINKIQFN